MPRSPGASSRLRQEQRACANGSAGAAASVARSSWPRRRRSPELAGEKVAVKAHAEAIDKLRERWKELDKLGGATSKTLWLAFDGALKAAYAPVAAHLEKLKAARNENLAARNR